MKEYKVIACNMYATYAGIYIAENASDAIQQAKDSLRAYGEKPGEFAFHTVDEWPNCA